REAAARPPPRPLPGPRLLAAALLPRLRRPDWEAPEGRDVLLPDLGPGRELGRRARYPAPVHGRHPALKTAAGGPETVVPWSASASPDPRRDPLRLEGRVPYTGRFADVSTRFTCPHARTTA